MDRMPAEFYDLKLNPMNTVTALIARVRAGDSEPFRDFYVNNWFHNWGMETNRRMLEHYANDKTDYTVYGFLNGIDAPFGSKGKKLIRRHSRTHQVRVFHGRVFKAENPTGYEVVHGNPAQVPKLDQVKPKP